MARNILIFALVFLLAPLVLNASRLLHPGPWVGFVLAVVTLITQPSLSVRELVSDRSDRRSALLILIAAIVSQLTAVGEFALRSTAFPPTASWWVIFGALIAVTGLALRLWAIRTLGEFFTSTVRVRNGQRVLSDGPYHLVRHPSYAGTLLTLLGIAMTLGSTVGMILVIMINLPTYLYRIRVEETALLRGLGNEYARYRAATWRLVPFVV